jgi:hypothetical protein
VVTAQPCRAQRVDGSLELGGVALRYADSLSTAAATITPRLTADWSSSSLEALGTYSQFTTGGSAAQGILSASRFVPVSLGILGELSGFVGGSTHSDGTRTGEFIANARLHLPRGGNEIFVGIGAGRTWDQIAWRNVLLGEAGLSVTSGPTSTLFTITPTRVNDSIEYADTQASLSRSGERLDVGVLVGFRLGDQITTLSANTKSWVSASATYWVAPRIAVVAGIGNYPIDLTEGFPGGRFASLAVRIAGHDRRSEVKTGSNDEMRAPVASVGGTPPVTEFVAKRAGGDTVTLRVAVQGAQVVELNADFTSWDPMKLVPAGPGLWSVTLPLKKGQYQLNVRVNGGQWIVPPGLLSISDEFGGAVGLLVIE